MSSTVIEIRAWEGDSSDSLGGLSFQGCPPKLSSISSSLRHVSDVLSQDYHADADNTNVYDNNYATLIGQYVIAVRIPGAIEITGFSDVTTLVKVLSTHTLSSPTLVLSTSAPPYICNHGLMYRYDLPVQVDLGLLFDGFPAKVVAVDALSPFDGKIQPNQFVEAIVVPGCDDLTFEGGGFTGYRVSQHLQQTAHVAGRQIILKDSPIYSTGAMGCPDSEMRRAFDWRGFRSRQTMSNTLFARW